MICELREIKTKTKSTTIKHVPIYPISNILYIYSLLYCYVWTEWFLQNPRRKPYHGYTTHTDYLWCKGNRNPVVKSTTGVHISQLRDANIHVERIAWCQEISRYLTCEDANTSREDKWTWICVFSIGLLQAVFISNVIILYMDSLAGLFL